MSVYLPALALSGGQFPESRIYGQKDPWVERKLRKEAFTLVELLTALAVFSLLLVLLVQALNGILQSTRTENQQMDSIASARRALDVVNSDLKNAVVNENAAILAPTSVNTNLFAFITTRRGASGVTGHRYLAVSYTTNASDQLVRSYGSVDYTQTDILSATISAPSAPVEPLAKGIIAIQAQALADGSNSYPISDPPVANWASTTYNGLTPPSGYKALITRSPAFASSLTNRTHAIEIWIAVVNDQDYLLLKNSGKLASLKASLSADPTTWRATIDGSTIPSRVKSGIRILDRTIPVR